jgi:hypothetical protein
MRKGESIDNSLGREALYRRGSKRNQYVNMPLCILCLVLRNSFVKATWVAFGSDVLWRLLEGSFGAQIRLCFRVMTFSCLCHFVILRPFDGGSELSLSRGRYLWLKRLYKIWTVVPPKSLRYEEKSTVLKKETLWSDCKMIQRAQLASFFFSLFNSLQTRKWIHVLY